MCESFAWILKVESVHGYDLSLVLGVICSKILTVYLTHAFRNCSLLRTDTGQAIL